MTKNITRVLSIIAVLALCFLFAGGSPFWKESTQEKIEAMSAEDLQVTIVDEDTVRIENLIKDSEIYYCWVIKNYAEGLGLSSGTFGEPMRSNDVIELTYELIEKIQFQAVVTYDGYTYTSITYGITEGGSAYILDDSTATVETAESITRNISDIVSFAYLGFLLLVVLLYYVLPKRNQWMVLLAASVVFYLLSGVQYIVFIIASSWIVFRVTRKMSMRKQVVDVQIKEATEKSVKKELKVQCQRENRELLVVGLIATLGVMIVIKYTDFFLTNVNAMLHTEIELLTLVMPLGLSFYTFMLIAYVIDVYRGKYIAEDHFGRFFLFACFFPHVSQGPLARYNEVAPQLRAEREFDYDNFCFSAQRILWGFFVKIVLVDRIATLVDGVYSSYETQSGVMLMIASVAYSIQIYADFYSSMEIAIGSAQLFGIQLQENFMRPYFSTNMPEFWRRWHITLGTWFKDYVFYPISISKTVMKYSVKVRKKYGVNVARVVAAAPPIMGVWILTGLWHGSSWKFVAWGLFHGMLILLSTAFAQPIQTFLVGAGVKVEAWYYKGLQMLKVFLLCTIGRVFFRATTIGAAFTIFKSMITFTPSDTGMMVDFTEISMDIQDYIVLPIALAIFLTVSIIQERKGSLRVLISKWHISARWLIWLFLIFGTLLFGVYGPGTSPVFIYEAF